MKNNQENRVSVILTSKQIRRLSKMRDALGGSVSEIVRSLIDYGFMHIDDIYGHREDLPDFKGK